jgi:hypothetical protein
VTSFWDTLRLPHPYLTSNQVASPTQGLCLPEPMLLRAYFREKQERVLIGPESSIVRTQSRSTIHLKTTSICCITHSLQGLTATNEQLGANAAATATEFETFEDLLALSTTGTCAEVTAVGSNRVQLLRLPGLSLCSCSFSLQHWVGSFANRE